MAEVYLKMSCFGQKKNDINNYFHKLDVVKKIFYKTGRRWKTILFFKIDKSNHVFINVLISVLKIDHDQKDVFGSSI